MTEKTCAKFLLVSIVLYTTLVSVADTGGDGLLSRRKRYVVFPEGSSFSIALCLTMHTLTPDSIFTEGVNWGISYDLPNESKPELEPFLQLRRDKVKINKHRKDNRYNQYYGDKSDLPSKEKYYKFSGINQLNKADYHYLQRRYRRNLYNKLETIINAMGYDGRKCVLRALCEAAQRFMPKGKGLVEEMIRVVFTLPVQRMFSFEPDEHRSYAQAHRAGLQLGNCAASFPECGFSLIDMALGKYNRANSLIKPTADSSEGLNEILAAARLATAFFPTTRYTMK